MPMRASSMNSFSPTRSTPGSSTSNSSVISPTISSSRSSIVTRPDTPPYSSTTMAMWRWVSWNSVSSSSSVLYSGMKSA